LIQFLVKEMGFRILALDNGYSNAIGIDDYLQTGQGDLQELIRGFYWPFKTEEMVGLIKWMRTYNETATPDQRLHFVGISPTPGVEVYNRLSAFLGKAAPQFLEQNDKLLKQASSWNMSPLRGDSMEGRKANLAQLQAVVQYLTDNESKFAAQTSPAAARAAILDAKDLVDTFDTYIYDSDPKVSEPKLGHYLAQMTLDQLSAAGPDARMVLWGLNMTTNRAEATGAELGQNLGDAYYAIEFLFQGGTFRATDKKGRYDTMTAEPDSSLVEYDLSCAGLSDAFVDYRHTSWPDSVQKWLAEPRKQRRIADTYLVDQPDGYQVTTPLLSWDGLIYIVNITPSKSY
jgi:erythromycin esterase